MGTGDEELWSVKARQTGDEGIYAALTGKEKRQGGEE